MLQKIAIAGSGIAGSNLAAWLAKSNYPAQVYVYDPQLNYQKPCGNILLSEALEYLAVKPEVTNFIEEYQVWVNNKKIVSFSMDKNFSWMVIDKEKLVSSLREAWIHKYSFIRKPVDPYEIRSDYELVIDSRGPFSSNALRKILVARGIFEPKRDIEDRIILNFDTVNIGLSWIFPYRDKLNIGYGALKIQNPVERLKSFVESTGMGVFDKSAVRTSLLTIDYPLSRAIEGNVVRTGEALGLVLALGGEGNRQAIMSSKILADIIIHNENLDVYKKRLRRLFRETVKQGFVLKLLSSINDYKAIENAMSSLDVSFYKKFLLGSFNLKKAFLAGLKTGVFLRGSMRLYLEFIARYLSLFI